MTVNLNHRYDGKHFIEITADVTQPSGYEGQFEGGSIEIESIKYEGVEMLWLFDEFDKEEEIIELIRNFIN